MAHTKSSKKTYTLLILAVVIAMLIGGCSTSAKKTYLIGVANESHNLDAIMESFKANLAEMGYVEGKNTTYIYHDPLGTDAQVNDAEIRGFMDQKVDLILTLGTGPTVAAKNATQGTNVPVVFAPVMDPVNAGIVPSVQNPGGNLTGVQDVNNTPKVLDWLLQSAPGTKQVYAPYNPADAIAQQLIKSLPEAAAQLGVELMLAEVTTGEEELAAIRNLPEDSAILFITSPSLNPYLEEAVDLATELGIPTASRTRTVEKMLIIYTADPASQGEQAAVLADKILKGSKPGDLPVATGDFFLSINLKTAEALGINISDGMLKQAQKIIR